MPTIKTKPAPPTSNDGHRFLGLPPTLTDAALLQLLPNASLADRVDAKTFRAMDPAEAAKVLDKYLLKKGIPLVIDGWEMEEDWPSIMNLTWLERNWEGRVPVKNLYDGAVTEVPLARFLKNMATEAKMFNDSNYNIHNLSRRYAKDLDCPVAWQRALEDFLPGCVQYMRENDLMSTLPEEKRPANLMLYIGAEGTYTPIHTDMCGTLGHNLIIDAAPSASALWLIVPARDRPAFTTYLSSLSTGINLHTERYLLSLSDFASYPGPLYLISQKLGDFALIPSMSAHQVWNRGGGTCKVAWNRTTPGTLRNACVNGGHLEEYRGVCRDEQFMVKQTIQDAGISLFNQLVRQLRNATGKQGAGADQKTANDFLLLFQLFTQNLREEVFPPSTKTAPRPEIELVEESKYDVVCSFCRANIWNTFLTCRTCSNVAEDDSFDICMDCYISGRSCQHLSGGEDELGVCVQQDWEGLLKLHRKFWTVACRLVPALHEDKTLAAAYSLESPVPTLAAIVFDLLRERPDARTLKTLTELETAEHEMTLDEADFLADHSTTCHFCLVSHPSYKVATCECGQSFCYDILRLCFGTRPIDVLRDGKEEWECPYCMKRCFCEECKALGRKGQKPRDRVLGVNYALVAHPLAKNWIVDELRNNEEFLEGGNSNRANGANGNGVGRKRGWTSPSQSAASTPPPNVRSKLGAATNQQRAPLTPVAPTAPMAPVAPTAPTALVASMAPIAPMAPTAPVAPHPPNLADKFTTNFDSFLPSNQAPSNSGINPRDLYGRSVDIEDEQPQSVFSGDVVFRKFMAGGGGEGSGVGGGEEEERFQFF